ncbi:MAG TPA: SDR family NAD(P)-dependent oxidoreductase, partial [Acetobacteraceae bacterium]|nr:SDR family NAD(P)-dependent oxidoreductase [Acetobacteraceae bacterium]
GRPSRWSRERYLHPTPRTRGRSYTFDHGLIANVSEFDVELFGISPREAQQIDPQQLLLLEVTYEALEDAGLSRTVLAGSKVGVFVGASFCDHFHRRLMDVATLDGYFMTGAAMSILSNRISHAFDWKGPSMTVDTACSSSLVALHLACQALRVGEVDTAIVGAVNLLLAPEPFVGFSQAALLSPSGRCRPFSAEADGYVRSEGAAAIVLRRSDALAPDNAPRAWVLGTGSNSDGHTNGISLPNSGTQAALLREVYAAAGVAADDLCYLEAHATGTAVGDPIEARAIGETLGCSRVRPLPVGSAKSSFGHLEAASGMVGLFAAMTVVQSRSLPRLAHFAAPNPNIDFAGLCLAPTAVARPLADHEAAIVGVNSFGFGGTNAHAIIAAEPLAPVTPRHRRAAPATAELPPLILSAHSAPALAALADRWVEFLPTVHQAELVPTLRGAARGRPLYDHRLVAHGSEPQALTEALRSWRAGSPTSRVISGQADADALGFVFAGNGSQWPGMGQLAMAENRTFRVAIGRLDGILGLRLGWSIVAALEVPDPARLRRTDVAQPLLFAIQYALVEALAEAGIRPAAVVGHSVGEIGAAWACGALGLEDALDVLIARSSLQQRSHGLGRMAVCGLDSAALHATLAEHGLALEIAAMNAPRAVTVAGSAADIARLGTVMRAADIFFSELDLDYAFHSSLLDPIEQELRHRLAGLVSSPAVVPFVSTVTGEVESAPALDAEYWWRNIREPVRLDAALDALDALGVGTLLEIGPHPVLQFFLRQGQRKSGRPIRVLASLARGQTSEDPVLGVIAACHVAGQDIGRGPLFDGERRTRELPRYPFQRQTISLASSIENLDVSDIARTHPLLGFPIGDSGLLWRAQVDTTLFPWLGDHVVDGDVIIPATALLDMALAAARVRFADNQVLDLLDVEFRQPVLLEAGSLVELGLQISPERNTFEIVSRTRLSDAPWRLHVSGRLAVGEWAPAGTPLSPLAGVTMAPDVLYDRAASVGLHYGTTFRTVETLTLHDTRSATVTLRVPDADHGLRALSGSILDPAWVDGSLHGLIGLLTSRNGTDPAMMLPRRFARLRHFGSSKAVHTARLTIVRTGPRAVEAAIQLLDADGERVADMSGVWLARVPLRRQHEALPLWATELRSLPPLRRPMSRLRAPLTGPALGNTASQDAAILLDACISSAAYAALAPLAAVAELNPVALVAAGDVHPAARRLLQHLLQWLEADGLASHHGGAWRLAEQCDLPAAPEIWRSLLGDLPQISGELALLGAAIEGLPRALANGSHAAADLSRAMLEQMLKDGPDGHAIIAAVAGRVAGIANACSVDRPLRILEIGARDASLARTIARLLGRSVPGLYYVVAIAGIEAADLPDNVLHGLPGRFEAWDQVSEPPPEILPGAFDLIIGTYAGSLGPAGRALPTILAPLLAPEGRMILAEPLPNRLWQLALDGDLERSGGTGQHLLSGASWLALMDGAGLRHAHAEQIAGMIWPASLLEGEAPLFDEPTETSDRQTAMRQTDVLLVGEPEDALTQALIQQLGTQGQPPRCCRLPELLAELERPASDIPASDIIVITGDTATASRQLGNLAGAIGRIAKPARLCLVTRGDATGEPVAAALEAALRVLANENNGLCCRSIRISRNLLPEVAAMRIVEELQAGADEPELYLSATARQAPRVRRLSPATLPIESAQLAIGQPGNLDTLHWHPFTATKPGAGEVMLDVAAAGINFRDLMWSLGVLPDEALLDGFAGATLGMECAGTVLEVGADITALQPGDRVMALAPAALATHTTTRAAACVPIPASMSFAAAATMPVAFMTVCHALGDLARITEGETVLVHAAAGGVGLAAIQYATARGAEVIVTAGSEVKRTFLRTLGIRHVFDSRSLRFADDVMAATSSRGVDVVLNSLHGEAMRRSMALLAPFGRFIELGKRDFIADTAVGVRPLRRNAAYFGVDTDHLAHLRPARAAAMLEELSALMASGALRPLPHRVMGYADVVEAFRVMQSAEHIGKLVLSVERAAPRVAPRPTGFAAEPAGAYVVSGGVNGFGLETAKWLAARGARHLALVGRRGGKTPGADEALAGLRTAGCDAQVYACDVSDATALATVLATVRERQAPIVGVVHAAMVLRDGMMSGMAEADFDAVMAPKFAGANELDRLTRNDPISLFLLFSSATTLLANPGQANYVAANAAIEALAERRRAEGLPALAVAWGPIADVGVLARDAGAADVLARRFGNQKTTARTALDQLDRMLASPQCVAAPVSVNWRQARQTLPGLASPRFSEIAARSREATVETGVALRELLLQKTSAEARAMVQAVLTDIIGEVLRLPAGRLQPQARLADIGIDSLINVEVRLAIEERFGTNLPMVAISDETTLGDMAEIVLRAIGVGNQEAPNLALRLAERNEGQGAWLAGVEGSNAAD